MNFKILSFIVLAVFSLHLHADQEIEIHDAHIHYDDEMWKALPPADALQILKDLNIKRVLVSSTPTEGAAMLYAADSEMVVPMLRPYDSWRHRYFWFKDPELKNYLLKQLKLAPYKGIGEFHVSGQDMDTPQIEQMIELATEYKLALHAHTDLEGMQILLKKSKGLVVIWAHGGFNVALSQLTQMLEQYPQFYIELSLREGMLDNNENLTQSWRQALIRYHRRFLTGMDTYKPSRWADLPEISADSRHWLKQLPEDVIVDIARDNLGRLFPKKNR